MKEIKISKWMVGLLALACGIIVANLYYSQPIISIIAKDLDLSRSTQGGIVTLTQIGYALGLIFLVPLSDIKENKKLIISGLLIVLFGLIILIETKSSTVFLMASFLIGLGSTSAQIIVPLATKLFKDKQNGKIIGNVMSGLLLGIMLARPVSSFISGVLNWRSVFISSAVLITIILILLITFVPERKSSRRESYFSIIKSMGALYISEKLLRRRSTYQALLFGLFSMFWTITPQWLMTNYNLNQSEVAIFGFVGISGALAAPIVGRLADKGHARILTNLAFVIAIFSFLTNLLLLDQSLSSLGLLTLSAIALDFAVSGNLVIGQSIIYSIDENKKGRINGVFMSIFFLGGALGSYFGNLIYANSGWQAAMIIGSLIPCVGLLYSFTESLNFQLINKH